MHPTLFGWILLFPLEKLVGKRQVTVVDVLGDFAVNIILSTLYFRHVDDIDLYTGGLSEIRTKGGLTGPTFACIIGKSFASWKFGDRFWYENNFKKTGFTPRKLFCLIFCWWKRDKIIWCITLVRKYYSYWVMGVMVFNATFNNIQIGY